MRKTTVYLSDEEAEGLRHLAATTGKAQAQLVREGVRYILSGNTRVFHSLGRGEGPGEQSERWDAGDLYSKVLGRD